ncbi:guanylate kinase [Desulfurivibrio alkaliphilus]|uniref:Guanylate kinase n=1 Tax=Desulfurivibrio alkaliphilus (strain DSM 19089 / UNIQEM U267 / AHT2) TaxID=589865 RepID=D6Z6N2_DESAT|nr:guanylate kinase [Desulfurivibrio alkaliphilus]ADH84991.1 guanylate kinase [Desulfurivibrio alkaliphilus AHT 2]
MNKGCLLVVSAPSGAGKTTLLKRILADTPGIGFSVSHTTRAPRAGEENGVDYHFIDRQEFTRRREADDFLEWAEVHGNFYGTSREAVQQALIRGEDILLDIDVQGARQLKEQTGVEAVFLFIAPPSARVLAQRLHGRGTDSREVIELRLENARREMQEADWYDYLVVNDELSEAEGLLRAIITAERCRRRRRPDGTPLPPFDS